MTDRRRVWITGLGIITACGTGLDAFRAGLRAARSPVKRIDRFDPSPFRSQVAAQVDDFDPLAWMPPKTARQLDRFSQFGLVAGRLALDDAGLTPGATGRRRPGADRDLSRLGARWHRLRGGAARALSRARDQGSRAQPGAGRVRRGGAGQPRHRPRRPRADPVDRQLVRVGCGRDRRGARGPARGSGRCGDRGWLRDPAERPRVRCLRHHPGAVGRPQRRARDGGPAVRRGPRRVRHGRGRRAAHPRGGGRGRATRRGPVRGGPRLRRDVGRPSHGPATGRRDGGRPGRHDRPGRRRCRGRCHRLRQRARVVHPDRRRGRGAGHRAGARRPRRDGAGQRHEGAVRAPARGVRCDRGGDLRAGHPRRLGARLGQPPRARSGRGGAAPRALANGPRRVVPPGPLDVVRVRRA